MSVLRRLSLMTVLVVVFAACGGGSDPGTTNPGGTQPGTTTTAGPGGTPAPTTTLSGPGSTSGPVDPGTGDSWWEIDGLRYEAATVFKCERVVLPLAAPAHDDDLLVAAVTDGQRQGLVLEFTGADGLLSVEHDQFSPLETALAVVPLEAGVSIQGNRILGGPLTVMLDDDSEVEMSFDIEIPDQLHPDC